VVLVARMGAGELHTGFWGETWSKEMWKLNGSLVIGMERHGLYCSGC